VRGIHVEPAVVLTVEGKSQFVVNLGAVFVGAPAQKLIVRPA
jgi:hypothetical protein